MLKPFSWPVRVYYQHTDAGGIVYHGVYLDFMEAARTELLRAPGFELAHLAVEEQILFIIHRIIVDYHRPARLNDQLTVTAAIARAGHVRLEFDQRVLREHELLVVGRVRLACVDARTLKPAVMPADLREKVQG
jgi:acyl-CoA thioester hydrolase